ncbi:MAG: toxin-antitoxin system protein [Bacteroides sp.]|uniref:toxin-antitoxin system protein n=1 Tax=Candidatus Cryptobacteroides bacterium TaxID=3085639 RepID=UPI003FEE355A|nr:toxin-antitoxin system protein [Bacteroides sp.]
MNTVAVDRKQTAFRLRTDLLDRLKVAAKKENRSLNNFVESVLLDAVYREPNEETLTAMKDAKENGNLETLDLDNFEKYVESLK